MINLIVNGKENQLEGSMDLIGYLESLNVNMKFIAVAHNGEVVPRDELGEVTLQDGDRLEIVRAVGGGC